MKTDDEARDIMKKTFDEEETIRKIKEATEIKKEYYGGTGFEFMEVIIIDMLFQAYVYGPPLAFIVFAGAVMESSLKEELTKISDFQLNESDGLSIVANAAKSNRYGQPILLNTAKDADRIVELRNKYTHWLGKETTGFIDDAKKRHASQSETWIQKSKFSDILKSDAMEVYELAIKVLLDIYSERRYPSPWLTDLPTR